MAQNLIPTSIHDSLPAMVRNELSSLPPHSQEAFVEEYRRKSKSTGMAYLLWFTGIGLLGFHYAYVGKWGLQILYWLTLGGLLIWWFIDLFRVPSIISHYNKDVAVDVLRSSKRFRAERAKRQCPQRLTIRCSELLRASRWLLRTIPPPAPILPPPPFRSQRAALRRR